MSQVRLAILNNLNAIAVALFLPLLEPPKYELEKRVVQAEVGTRVSIKFTVISDVHSGTVSKHKLKKQDSDNIETEHYKILEDRIIFEQVSLKDKGAYVISCRNDAGEGYESFEVDVIPVKGTISIALTLNNIVFLFSSTKI